MNKILLFLLATSLVLSCSENKQKQYGSNINGSSRIVYSTSMVFRETPYADISPAKIITKSASKNRIHFELFYDNSERLIEVKYVLNEQLKSFSDRFIRAPHIKIQYKDNKEIRTFFNEHGHRTLVSGDVYEVQITLNELNERTSLTFYDLNGDVTENDFGIATYQWKKSKHNSIIEHRYDLNNQIVRNRPGFGYLVTKFKYGQNGLLHKMINLGLEGKEPIPDEAGVVSTKIGYDEHGQFIQWLNLDKDDKPIKGMSAIAEILYIPSNFKGEKEAKFIDENGMPQTTRWEAHNVAYEFDSFGNELKRKFFGIDNNPKNANNGVGQIKSEWTDDGMHRVSRKYFDKDGKAVGVGPNNIHEIKTEINEKGLPISVSNYNLDRELVTNSTGYAKDSLLFDNKGRLIKRMFLNEKKIVANHNIWGVSIFEYSYKNDLELNTVNAYDVKGNQIKPSWNPIH